MPTNVIRAVARAAAAAARRLSCALVLGSVSAAAAAADSAPLGREVFTKIAQPPCALCHTLKDAGAAATLGPNLDKLKADAQRVERAVRKGVGVMPPYEGKLTPEQIAAVAAYVAKASGAAK